MNTTICRSLLAAALLALPACGEGADEFEVETEELRELFRQGVIPQGELRIGTPETRTLAPRTSGFHLYTFAKTLRGSWKTTFVQKSGAFQTFMRVTSPSGMRWNAVGVRESETGIWYSVIETELLEVGTYEVLATSVQNLRYRRALSAGEYTLSAEAQIFCGGLKAFPCPDYLKCVPDGDWPDAGGICAAPNACRVPADCEGQPAPDCLGEWSCNIEGGADLGSCSFTCGISTGTACADRPLSTCGDDPSCEVVIWGCENPCDPETGVCHPCDPMAECREKVNDGGAGDACGVRGTVPCQEGLYCAFSLDAQCGMADHPGVCTDKPEACITLWDPVCGCDGRTYSNTCFAAANGISVKFKGACRSSTR